MRISVIVPTYQRRETVLSSLDALAACVADVDWEVIVVVDGSTDGTAEAIRGRTWPLQLRLVEQPNAGLARARNAGAEASAGEILLFLDDDMVADPRLVTEHDRSHHAGADAVMGRIPLHPDSPPGLLSDGVRAWADELATRLTRGGRIGHDDLVGGQLSVRRDVFDALGGFDTAYTAGGAYGGEDLDFGYRLQKAGYRIVFNPHAASYQRYVVDPATHLRQHRSAGAADVALVTRHPELAHDVFTGKRRASRIHQLIAPVVVTAPKLAAGFERLLTPIAVALVARGRRDTLTRRLFVTARTIAYWQGVRAAGGPLDGRPEASESAGSTA